jgi:hypothetical protein
MPDAYVHIDAHEIHDMVSGVNRRLGQVNRRTKALVTKTGETMKATAIALSPDLTGEMDASMDLGFTGLGFDLGPTVKHGRYVELGTEGPYQIENAFGWGVTVTHPPNAPEPFLSPAFDAGLPGFVRDVGQIGEDVWGRG